MILIELFYLVYNGVITMLLINCYTCPIFKTKQIQAHDIRQNEIVKSYAKMAYDDLHLFNKYNNVILVNVNRASDLGKVNFINFNNFK